MRSRRRDVCWGTGAFHRCWRTNLALKRFRSYKADANQIKWKIRCTRARHMRGTRRLTQFCRTTRWTMIWRRVVSYPLRIIIRIWSLMRRFKVTMRTSSTRPYIWITKQRLWPRKSHLIQSSNFISMQAQRRSMWTYPPTSMSSSPRSRPRLVMIHPRS